MTARILDKMRDSQKVAKLVEDLQQAILIYQVGTIHQEPRESGMAYTFRIAIAAAIDKQPGLAVDCKPPPIVLFIGTDGWCIKSSHLSMRF